MPPHQGPPRARRNRRGRQIRPCLVPLEPRVVPSLAGAAGITIDTSGDVFVSFNSTGFFTGQQQSVAEFDSQGNLLGNVFTTTGSSAYPGALAMVGSSISLPNVNAGDILELQPNGQLFDFTPGTTASFQFDNLASDTPNASSVYDIQTGSHVDLTTDISLASATFGDFGVYGNSIVVSAESNNWDFVMRLTYGASSKVATVLVASPASDGLSATPEGVAVDTQGTVLATLPYVLSGSGTAIHVPVGFNINYDTGGSPAPLIPMLGLTSTPNIDSSAITVDSQNNFILAVTDTSLFSGPGVAHINGALTAFLADPLPSSETTASAIAYQDVSGSNELALAEPQNFNVPYSYTVAGELPLFSGQVTPAQLRSAYGINQITFTNSQGQTVTGDGSGQTIAIVEEGVDPTLQADLATFDNYFGISAPPRFQVIDQGGSSNVDTAIVGEASLDVEWAHAIAPGASIIVYNATYDPNNLTVSFENLLTAMKTVSTMPGVSVVTLSYGLPEDAFAQAGLNQKSFDANFTTSGVTFLAAAGDTGIFGDTSNPFQPAADYPAASPNVVSVGGTSIVIDSAGDYPGTGPNGEIAWGTGSQSGVSGGGGGGLSSVEPEPSWQKNVVPATMDQSGTRALPDVSMDSGAAQEYDVFTSTLSGSSVSASAVGWLGDAGTSAASPIWAGLIAIADQGRALAGGSPLTGSTQTLPALYSLASNPTTYAQDFHDIVNGNNGDSAEVGYDLASGLGTPIANMLVPALAAYGLAVPSQFSIKTEPPATVAVNGTFGLTVQVEDSQGNPVNSGSVTVGLANNPGNATLGGKTNEPVVDGLATFTNLFLTEPGNGYTLIITDSNVAGTQTTTAIDVTGTNKQTATLGLSDLSYTYDGSPHFAVATTNPVGLSGVTITYMQNGLTVPDPTHAGDYTVTAALNNANYTAQPAVGTLVISQAMPQVSWAKPANITVGTKLTSAQLDATASFNGLPLAGTFNYTPGFGTLLGVGYNQTLMVSFVPSDSTDFQTVNASVQINVVPQSTPPPHAVVIGESPVFQRLLNKRGKPTGKAVLTGFTLDYNMALSAAAAASPSNYQLDEYAIEKVRRKVVKVLVPITNFTVTYAAANHSVTLHLARQTFPKGGKLRILPGVTSGSGSVLAGNAVFTITAGGKAIVP
jgi:hypothetical protein